MDNENGTAVAAAAAVVTTKVDAPETTTIKMTDAKTVDPAIGETVKNADIANLDATKQLLVESAVRTDEVKALNNASTNDVAAVNRTTTTVTVNVTQTKVVTVKDDDVVDKGQSIGEVVSTVSSIAEAAVGAIDKVDKELKKPPQSIDVNSIEDVEMLEPADPADCEMKDVSLTKEQQAKPQVDTATAVTATSSSSSIEAKNAEADSVNSTTTAVTAKPVASIGIVTATNSNEAEQKIVDDVEKNISNLFNGSGDDNGVGSTNDDDDDRSGTIGGNSSKLESRSTAAIGLQQGDVTDILKNGTGNARKQQTTQSQHDVIKDNNDLVSILAGSDHKPEESNISSSSVTDAPHRSDADKEAGATKIENKLLKGVTSTPSSSSSATTNVYNSTPIQKQFEISSENVSTISTGSNLDTAAVDSHGLGGKASRQELISSHSSTINDEKMLDISATNVTAGSESSSSADNLTSFAKDVQNINGLSDESTDTSSAATATTTKHTTPARAEKSSSKLDDRSVSVSTVDSSVKTTPKTPATKGAVASPEQSVFDVNFCYDDGSQLIYFNVEKQDSNKTTGSTTSDKSSVVSGAGSVNSVTEPFALPVKTVTSNNSTLSSSSASSAEAATPTNQLEKLRKEVKGTVALCTFIIDHFEKLRAKLTGQDRLETTTPAGRRGRNPANAEPTTPSTATNTGSKRKRAAAAVESPSLNDTIDSDVQPKSAKKAKKESTAPKTPAAAKESNYPEKAVLARWVDKKFYAGRVIEEKPNNKYVVLFEDGAKKTLPEEHIVFGKENNILPLVNENVHALVAAGDTYEPGNVQSVETKDDGTVYYTVLCESTTVTVTASDIYLEEDQAKVILSKHASNNPEPGFSGGLSGGSTRKDRRNKRAESSNRHVQWFSESDVSDINESDSRPASPVNTVLEAVDGVQPELQHTQKESELVRICYLMERFGSDFKRVNLDNVLGPTINSSILKNKSFLLTCTIPIKIATSANGTNGTTDGRQNNRNNGYDFGNRNTIFSTVPFFKDYLKHQIESAGGTVYSNFENVPSNKFRSCFLLSPFPCITAKYVQCLAANITAVSHEWIVDSCQRNKLLNKDDYVLPSGWSIVEAKYKPWSMGGGGRGGRDQRKNVFSKTTIIITSQQSDFVEFWSRVCKSAGAKIRLVRSSNDLTATTKGYILLDDEFPPEYQNRAERFHIPIVSTVWVIQSLIACKVLDPNAHPKLTQLYEDDYF